MNCKGDRCVLCFIAVHLEITSLYCNIMAYFGCCGIYVEHDNDDIINGKFKGIYLELRLEILKIIFYVPGKECFG